MGPEAAGRDQASLSWPPSPTLMEQNFSEAPSPSPTAPSPPTLLPWQRPEMGCFCWVVRNHQPDQEIMAKVQTYHSFTGGQSNPSSTPHG